MLIHSCVFCRKTGSGGSKWILRVSGEADRRVHKPCGEILVAKAPQGVVASIMPSPELREAWRADRVKRDAEAFWKVKFQKAEDVARQKAIKIASRNTDHAQAVGDLVIAK